MKYNQKQPVGNRSIERSPFSGNTGAGRVGGFRGGGAVFGEVIAKDETSITVNLRGGGSKIVFLFSKTEVMKSSPGSAQDIGVGTNGTMNTDGSVTAQMIQIRLLLNNQ